MPVASKELPGGKDLKEMVVNEEGLFNNSFQTNHKARKLIAQGLGVQLDAIQDIRGDVFVTDGWRIVTSLVLILALLWPRVTMPVLGLLVLTMVAVW